MPSRSPSGSILKKPKNNGNYDAATNMQTIKEYDRTDFNSSFNENENVMNMSGNTLSMSVKDPSRPPKIIEGLTDFLQDEYNKRLGVHTQESKDLLQFWRNYVSVEYREQRKLKQQDKSGFNSFLGDNGYEQGNSLAPSPKKHKSMVYMGVNKDQFKATGKAPKPPVKLPKNGVMSKYEEFGTLFELDVEYSLQKEIKQRLDREKQQQLKREMNLKSKEEDSKKKTQIKKINDMLKAYFDDIANKKILKKKQEMREEQMYLQSDKKDAPKPALVPKRPQSAAPSKAKSMKVETEQEKKLRIESEKIREAEDLNRKNLVQVMLAVHDYCFMEYQQYESRKDNYEKQKQDYFASLNEHKRKGGKSIVMAKPEEFKLKPPAILPINSVEVLNAFKKNRARSNCDLSDGQVQGILSDYFSPFNMVKRILLYRDVINKSERRGKITVHSFYLNTRPEDQQLFMFQFGPGTNTDKDGNLVQLNSDQHAAKVIKEYEVVEAKKAEDREKKKLEKQRIKDEKYKNQVMTQVFGEEKWKEGKGLELKNRPDYTVPKDKWKLGKQLKELQRKFPHDRVIQRMVEQEYQTNQPFMHPEEYDLFNQAEEYAYKKNFTGKTQTSGIRGVPDFKKEQEKIDKFKERDQPDKRGEEIMAQKKLKDEANLEAWLQKQAYDYKDLMTKQHDPKSNMDPKDKKTLRTRLAEYYNEMVKKHGEVAKKRFPHLAYGQDPNSETFKKSFPLSFKRYFFKLVKSIILTAKGKVLCKRPATLVMAVGAREAKLQDPVGGVKSMNTRLNATKIGAHIRAMKNKQPNAWRSRAWRRNDMKKKLRNVFMQFSELENCKFEPECGSLANDKEKEAQAGEYFEKFGNNFQAKNPELFKYGKMKQARAQIRTGTKTYTEVLKTLGDAMNLNDILQYYRPDDYKVYTEGKKILNEEKEMKESANDQHKHAKAPSIDEKDKKILNMHQNITPEDLKDINDAFDQFRKLDPMNASDDGVIKVNDLGLAMRKVRFTPGPVELQEIQKEVDVKTEKQLLILREEARKKNDPKGSAPSVHAGVDRQWFTRIISSKMNEFQSEKELAEAFNILDTDGSKSIDTKEFAFVMRHLGQGFTDLEIKEMIKAADTDGDGQIDQKEFIAVMKSQGKGKLQGTDVMQKMRTELKRFLKHQKLLDGFKNMKPHIKWIFDQVDAMNEEYKMDHKKKKPMENFNQSMFDDVWEILQIILKQAESNQKNQKLQDKSKKLLTAAKKGLIEQKQMGFDAPAEGDEENSEIDYRKIYKTIMCPLKDSCPKLKRQRWPYTGMKSHAKLGKDCPYAHHAMELAFPQTINMRLAANEKMSKTDNNDKAKQEVFSYSGQLQGCQGCGNRCNLCRYNSMAKEKVDAFTNMKTSAAIDSDKVADKKVAQDESDSKFAKKFGILKKASVLLHYERPNDAFNEIAKAVQIIKDQQDVKKENELLVQKRWQFKLGLPDGLELPKPYDKIKPEDMTDAFLKSIDSSNADFATLKLYISKVCPLVRSAFDRDAFLNGLIQDLYFKCEDLIQDKVNNIAAIVKNKEKLVEVHELIDALGSDAEKDTDALVDNDGNPIKMKKKRVKMCESVQKKKTYKEDGIEMKTKDKYYIDNSITKSNTLDKNGRMNCTVCPAGKKCAHAHTAIELDLTPLPHQIKNLNGLIKSQQSQLKQDKPIQPWKPAASDFKREDLPEYTKKKKFNADDDEDKKNKRKGILERENVFRKPYDKE